MRLTLALALSGKGGKEMGKGGVGQFQFPLSAQSGIKISYSASQIYTLGYITANICLFHQDRQANFQRKKPSNRQKRIKKTDPYIFILSNHRCVDQHGFFLEKLQRTGEEIFRSKKFHCKFLCIINETFGHAFSGKKAMKNSKTRGGQRPFGLF